MRKFRAYETVKHGLALALEHRQPIPEQTDAAGFDDTFDLWKQCLRPSMPDGEVTHFPSDTAEAIRAFYALGTNSLPWFTGFRPVLRKEITGPDSDVDTDVLAELRRLDPDLDPSVPLETRQQKAAAGWAAVHGNAGYRQSLRKSAQEAGHPTR